MWREEISRKRQKYKWISLQRNSTILNWSLCTMTNDCTWKWWILYRMEVNIKNNKEPKCSSCVNCCKPRAAWDKYVPSTITLLLKTNATTDIMLAQWYTLFKCLICSYSSECAKPWIITGLCRWTHWFIGLMWSVYNWDLRKTTYIIGAAHSTNRSVT